ncbi:MAG: DUF4465 domain-containing protein [Alistipes sp.]|nr:DUF4465 domain-containing protein [Alistipes sp.]
MKKLLFLALALAVAVACEKEEGEVARNFYTIDFEAAELNSKVATLPSTWDFVKEGYGWEDKANSIAHTSIFTNDYGYVLYGGGLTLSRYSTNDIERYGTYESDLYVYSAEQKSDGADGDNTFLIAYGNYEPEVDAELDMRPSITFTDGSHTVMGCFVNSTSYFLNIAENGNPYSPALKDGDEIKIYATGYDEAGREGKTVEMTFARKGKLIKKWTRWNLAALGKVRSIKFNIRGGNTDEWGMTTPKYFAIDDIVVER